MEERGGENKKSAFCSLLAQPGTGCVLGGEREERGKKKREMHKEGGT